VSNERVIEVGKKEKPKGKKPVFSPPKQVKTTPAAPRRATIAFQPPVVTRDEMAPETTQADVETLAASTAEIGAVDASGDPNAAPTVVEDDFLETGTPAGNAPADDQAFSIIDVQKLPAFPGGDEAMMDFIRQHLTYPAYARELGIQGTVVLSFTVGKNGAIYDIQTIKDIGAGCAQEAARVVALMPAWRPGEANGQAVKVRFTLPIRFRLQ
jgi:protein TonB